MLKSVLTSRKLSNPPFPDSNPLSLAHISFLDRFGISFLGAAFSEASLIGFAYAYEQRTMARNQVQPYIVPTTELINVVGKGTVSTMVKRGPAALPKAYAVMPKGYQAMPVRVR